MGCVMSGVRKVLVVDDSRFARSVASKLINEVRPGWSIEQAAGGRQALEMCESEQFDLVTIDMHMPEMDGFELVEKLRERGNSARLVLITANIQDAVRDKAEARALHIVPKPLSADKVRNLVGTLESQDE